MCLELRFSCSHASSRSANRRALSPVCAATVEFQRARASKWDDAWYYLAREMQLDSVPPAEAANRAGGGQWVLVDVRPKHKYEASHAEGAVNVEYIKRVDWSKPDFVRYLRAIGHLSNGVDPVEPNADFVEELEKASGGKGVLLMCEIGGTLQPSTSFATGKMSRSLLAAHDALRSGRVRRVSHVKGGLYGYHLAGLPIEGEYDTTDIGRTPSVVEEEIFSYGRPTESLEEVKSDNDIK
ncbi:hypothetical protein WJX81_002543 [Elliptochloris bilobata]|uniref:Rhodanese domain-containing protein n=1 Tax=Elliptochloris bilobata TaxID=381761 RepID=A0AAW1RIZ5_9CHLO